MRGRGTLTGLERQGDFDTGVLKRNGGRGSMRIEFYANVKSAELAMRGIKYLTNNPNYPEYNRLYRLPEAERDPTTFKIDANDYDVLHITANDMGNSGGADHDIKEVRATRSGSIALVCIVLNFPILMVPTPKHRILFRCAPH